MEPLKHECGVAMIRLLKPLEDVYKRQAGRRAESVQRERQQNEEEKRRKRLEEIKDVLPFRIGDVYKRQHRSRCIR